MVWLRFREVGLSNLTAKGNSDMMNDRQAMLASAMRELTVEETEAVSGAIKTNPPPKPAPILPGDNPLDPNPGIPC
jgi:hypothetical protein